MNKQGVIETIKNIDTLNINDMIAGQQVDMVIKNQVLDIISQIDEPEKPVVPQVAIDYYEQYKGDLLSLSGWFDVLYQRILLDEFPDGDKLKMWLHNSDYKTNQQRELSLATLLVNGVEAVQVEQEKLYTVEIPNPNLNAHVVLQKTGEGLALIMVTNARWKGWESSKLTEAEIKQDFEWAFQFAKPVEE